MKYHINPDTGNHGKCSAEEGNCPFIHGDSIQEARSNYESEMEKSIGVTTSLKKSAPKDKADNNDHPLAMKASEPMTMKFMRNPVSSQNFSTNHYFGQDIEPAGRYMSEQNPIGRIPDGWESGTIEFKKPLHIAWGEGGYEDDDNWKQRLSKHYGGKKGKALSTALRKDGYDAIVTHDKYGTSETIDLTGIPAPKTKSTPKGPTWNRRKKYPPKEAKNFAKFIESKHEGVQIWLDGKQDDDSYVTLGKIIIPKEQRGKGKGKKIMDEIIKEADRNNWKLALTPDDTWGSSVPRLKRFYSEFGFVENKGRNKDYTTMESMIRPQKSEK